MKNIDYYIDQCPKMDGGNYNTKAYPFVEDGVILVGKGERNFSSIQQRIKKCKDMGVNIPLYLDYKSDEEKSWILEELAPGQELHSLITTGDATKLFGNMPYEHIQKYIRDGYCLLTNGVGVETRRRNVFYDPEKGFTTIDVGLGRDNITIDSLYEVNDFFNLYYPILIPPFSSDEYGNKVREKTIVNILKAFEEAVPRFNEYKRWIYRGNSYFAEFLKNSGYELSLTDDEYSQLIDYINLLIDDIVKKTVMDPEQLFRGTNYSKISLLSASIDYCPNFTLFNTNEQSLDEYINKAVYSRIKEMFVNDKGNEKLKDLFIRIRKYELDPLNIYNEEYLQSVINEEINSIRNNNVML